MENQTHEFQQPQPSPESDMHNPNVSNEKPLTPDPTERHLELVVDNTTPEIEAKTELTETQRQNLEVMNLLSKKYPNAFIRDVDSKNRTYSILKEDISEAIPTSLIILCKEGTVYLSRISGDIRSDDDMLSGDVDISSVFDLLEAPDDGKLLKTTLNKLKGGADRGEKTGDYTIGSLDFGKYEENQLAYIKDRFVKAEEFQKNKPKTAEVINMESAKIVAQL